MSRIGWSALTVFCLTIVGGFWVWKFKLYEHLIPRDLKTMVLSDELMNGYLDNLALWANEQHVVVRLNGSSLTINFGGIGGWDYVGWRQAPGAFDEHKDAPAIRNRLRELLSSSQCRYKDIEKLFADLPEWKRGEPLVTPKTLSERLACAGKIDYERVSFSPF